MASPGAEVFNIVSPSLRKWRTAIIIVDLLAIASLVALIILMGENPRTESILPLAIAAVAGILTKLMLPTSVRLEISVDKVSIRGSLLARVEVVRSSVSKISIEDLRARKDLMPRARFFRPPRADILWTDWSKLENGSRAFIVAETALPSSALVFEVVGKRPDRKWYLIISTRDLEPLVRALEGRGWKVYR